MNTAKMAVADVERSVESADETVLNEPHGWISSRKRVDICTLKLLLINKMCRTLVKGFGKSFIAAQRYATCFLALIGCKFIQSFWSVPVDDAPREYILLL